MGLWRQRYLLMLRNRVIDMVLIKIYRHLLHRSSTTIRILAGMNIRRIILNIHLRRRHRWHTHLNRHRRTHRHRHLIHIWGWWVKRRHRMLIRIWLIYVRSLQTIFIIYLLVVGCWCLFFVSFLSINTIFLSLFAIRIGIAFLFLILFMNFLFFPIMVIVVRLAMSLIRNSLKNDLTGGIFLRRRVTRLGLCMIYELGLTVLLYLSLGKNKK